MSQLETPKLITRNNQDFKQMFIQRTTPRGLWNSAKDFLKGNQLISKHYPYNVGLSHVRYYLLGHSIELGLKAFLLKKGMSVDNLKRKLGHNLEACLKVSEERGFNILDNDDKIAIRILNAYYCSKDFEYPNIGSKTLPQLNHITAIATKIVEGIRDMIK